MQLTVKLIQLLPLQTGEGKNGPWKKQDIIVETDSQYPKKICISIWGDKINQAVLVLGATLNISFDVESREYNGKWYTDVKAWKIESTGEQQTTPPYEETDIIQPSEADEDLPF
ncbi:MAG: hypothetical protein COW85_14120 [Ignavibacteria bacterium CG22_combo_CG10-13_8_21_14_all_37_15]|nr:MAG: hypothetical protein COW85_14120 [Ignavibacteria bacterium CG22_combo_CG10-13_8_21_14_all_37_15]